VQQALAQLQQLGAQTGQTHRGTPALGLRVRVGSRSDSRRPAGSCTRAAPWPWNRASSTGRGVPSAISSTDRWRSVNAARPASAWAASGVRSTRQGGCGTCPVAAPPHDKAMTPAASRRLGTIAVSERRCFTREHRRLRSCAGRHLPI
jgi:hypothetical protein